VRPGGGLGERLGRSGCVVKDSVWQALREFSMRGGPFILRYLRTNGKGGCQCAERKSALSKTSLFGETCRTLVPVRAEVSKHVRATTPRKQSDIPAPRKVTSLTNPIPSAQHQSPHPRTPRRAAASITGQVSCVFTALSSPAASARWNMVSARSSKSKSPPPRACRKYSMAR
jgi:hypothetical protein